MRKTNMRIGVAGTFNLACVGEYLECMDAPEFNANASSVNIYGVSQKVG